MKMRLIIQPLIACVLAVRAGLRDARENKPPFLWALVFKTEHRGELLRHGWKDTGKVLIVCVVLDVIYQLIVLHMVYLGEAIGVGILLAVIPYVLLRALVGRLVGTKKRKP